MNVWASVSSWPGMQLLGWTLLHFCWQGCVIAGLYACVRTLLQHRPPSVRYAASCIALLLLALAPVATLLALDAGTTGVSATSPGTMSAAGVGVPWAPGDHGVPAAGVLSSARHGARSLLEAILPVCVGLWLAGVAMLTVRLLAGWRQLKALERQETTVIDGTLAEVLEGLRVRLAVRRPVRLLRSLSVEVPTVFGWWRPVILLPAGCLVRLSPQQLELCLAHELAHIRRLDLWVNLMQVILETVLFYHPAVWWISACVREEREMCCDEMAIRACGNRLAYAEALAALEEMRAIEPAMAMAASGGSLAGRIRHILGIEAHEPLDWRRKVGGTLLVGGVVLVVVGLAMALQTGRIYTATARLALPRMEAMANAPATGTSVVSGVMNPSSGDKYFILTEAEKMTSSAVLKDVVLRLDLRSDERWGGSRTGAERTAQSFAPIIARLRQTIRVRQVPGTFLVEVSASSPIATEAEAIANELCGSYLRRRNNADPEQLAGLEQLELERQKQQLKVRELERQLRELRRTYGIPATTTNKFAAPERWRTETAAALEQERIKVDASYQLWKAKWEKLRQLPTEKLTAAIQTVVPDQPLTQLMMDRNQAEQQLSRGMHEYTAGHPENEKLAAQIRTIDRLIETRVSSLMDGLRSQVESYAAAGASMSQAVEEARKDAMHDDPPEDYAQLQGQVQRESEILRTLELKCVQERISTEIGTIGTRASLVDPATVSLRPRVLLHGWAAVCVGAGGCSSLSGIGLLFIGRRRTQPSAA